MSYTPNAISNPMTTADDLIYGGTGGSPTRLGIGTAGQVLAVVGGVPTWTQNDANFTWSLKTASYTATATDTGILADATTAAVTITLPTAVGFTGTIAVKKKDSTTNSVTINTTSSQTIDGGSTAVIKTQYESLTFCSDGSNWYIA